MNHLLLALIRTSDAILTFHSFDTEDLDRQVADHCRKWWAEHMDGDAIPESDAEIIEAYFDNDGHGEWMDREEIDLAATAPQLAPSPRETATILAALRHYQACGFTDPGQHPFLSEHILDIATDHGDCHPLTSDEIDALCEALNFPSNASEGSTPPIQELRIILNAAAFLSQAEADEEHPDPIGDACELINEAAELFNQTFPEP